MGNLTRFSRVLSVASLLIAANLSMTAQSLETLKERAASGEAVAQYDLALMYSVITKPELR